jgi:alpha-L-fucosidase 2
MQRFESRTLSPAARLATQIHLILLMLLGCGGSLRAADVVDKIDWPAFLARHDMVWTHLPDKWGSGAFMGNGLLGANVFTIDGGKSLRWHIGRSDVTLSGNRIPIGDMVLKTAGTLESGTLRLDLWNAEMTGRIKTSKGEIKLRSFTHAQQMVQVIEIDPTEGEKDCRFEWQPGLAADPRKVYKKEAIPAEEKSPEPQVTKSGTISLCTQPLLTGGEHATAWTEKRPGADVVFVSVGFSNREGTGRQQAVESINKAVATGIKALVSTHRDWWHQYWPESFVSIPDTRLESFYWLQMYKLASATRPGRPAIDLMGPWFNTTPWAKIWWNLNIQLTYWPILTANRLELGEPFCKMLDDNAANLAANAKKFSADSSTIGRSASYDCVRTGGSEMCDFPWALHNYCLQYRYSMDDPMLRDRLFPLLKRAMNYYFHHMTAGPDGLLHITEGLSPEYPNQPSPNPDCNIDLALIRWGCQTLLASCERLKIEDPLIPKWKETLEKLTPYPADEHGLKISAAVPFAQSHRHYSHLLMMYPLYIMNFDQPENRMLMIKSFDHWTSLPKAHRGYSYTGAASISAAMYRSDDALMYLNRLLDEKILPNTLYTEAGPCIETPLSGAAALNDMLLTSWGGKIRVFPGAPAAWHDITIHNLRAQGAFLVSAVRKNSQIQFIRITSLAGEPCRLVTNMPSPAGPGVTIRKLVEREYELDLKKGQTVVLTPNGVPAETVISAVASQKERENYYGLH